MVKFRRQAQSLTPDPFMKSRFNKFLLLTVLLALFGAVVAPLRAEPIVPTRDDEVIEVLPAMRGSRAEERRLRKQLAQAPRDPALALTVAKRTSTRPMSSATRASPVWRCRPSKAGPTKRRCRKAC